MKNSPKQNLSLELTLFGALLMLAVVSRFWLVEIPNFKPVAAIALLSGLLFSRFLLAIALPVCAMLLSDWQIGAYDMPVMLAVYSSLLLCPIIGWSVSRWAQPREFNRTQMSATVSGCALLISVLFYLLTNFAVWQVWYGGQVSELLTCYIAAIPFFKYTLMSNLVFSLGGLSVYWIISDLLAKIPTAERSEFPSLGSDATTQP